MARRYFSSEFLEYLASTHIHGSSDADQLPSLNDISTELGVSVARLREQLEVAEALGLVEVRPRTGIRRLPYQFAPAVSQSLSYAIELDSSYFDAFSELRNQLETAFWDQAVHCLTPEDHNVLKDLINRAWAKLDGEPVQIPHEEHRLLHLTIYNRLNNPFVQGILESYWEAYEAIGLSVYTDYHYLQQVWQYHQAIVEAIILGDYQVGYQALVEHIGLLNLRPIPEVKHDSTRAFQNQKNFLSKETR
jgi:DNA-binding FadR family transcriptional regulator